MQDAWPTVVFGMFLGFWRAKAARILAASNAD